MNIAVIGTGYVGLPTGVGFAETGHKVICIDTDKEKIIKLKQGQLFLYEKGLQEALERSIANNKINFSTDISVVSEADVVIIAVGTPQDDFTGEADLTYVFNVVRDLTKYIKEYKVIAVKSTVPVGSCDKLEAIIKEEIPQVDFDLVSLPEFLREGYALEDFFNPDRIVVGTESPRAKKIIQDLYSSTHSSGKLLFVSRRSSETIKYASNSFLAMKIHFINEMADFCEKTGANIDEVAVGMGMDSRIGSKFLQAGPGFGGSCFPKDTSAIFQMAIKAGVNLSLVEKTIEQNRERKKKLAKRIAGLVSHDEQNPVIGILGITFKAGTDDLRDSPALEIVQELIKMDKYKIKIYDPQGTTNAKATLGETVEYAQSSLEVFHGANVVALLTEWAEFASVDFYKAAKVMSGNIIFDARNILNSKLVSDAGFKYISIGNHV